MYFIPIKNIDNSAVLLDPCVLLLAKFVCVSVWIIIHIGKSRDHRKSIVFLGFVAILVLVEFLLVVLPRPSSVITLLYKKFLSLKATRWNFNVQRFSIQISRKVHTQIQNGNQICENDCVTCRYEEYKPRAFPTFFSSSLIKQYHKWYSSLYIYKLSAEKYEH